MFVGMPFAGVILLILQMNVKFYAFNVGSKLSRRVKTISLQSQLFEFALQLMKVNPEIEKGAEKHVPAYPTKNVQVQNFHF